MMSQKIRLAGMLLLALRAFAAALITSVAFASMGGLSEAQTNETIVVSHDRGGKLGQRSHQVRYLRATGQRVELRGVCLSACTMYLSLPNVCVSPSARLGFHGPTRNGQRLTGQDFQHWSEVMADNYREPLRSWYLANARYRTSGYLEIRGADLITMGYRRC